MKNLITKMFDLEERKIHDIEVVTTDEDVYPKSGTNGVSSLQSTHF